MLENYWNEFEYNKLKLLLNQTKVNSIFNILDGKKQLDERPPISAELHLTNSCNLKCQWCTDKELKEQKASQNFGTLKELFKTFRENNTGVTIEGGGEPTIYKQFSEIIRFGADIDLDMGLITNGVMDISDVAPLFKWIRVSLDSSTKEEYLTEKGVDAFDKVISNLNKISRKRDPSSTHLGIGYVITKRNMDNIPSLLQDLDALGIDYAYMRPVEEAPEIEPSIDDLFELKKELIELTEHSRIRYILTINDRLVKNNDNLPCVAHSLSCIIRADGSVALCEKRRHDPIILGNINHTGFNKIWSSDIHRMATNKLLCPENQNGCSVCRMTSFNRLFVDVNNIHTKNFI